MSFSGRLVERRKTLGISQRQLATKLNVTPTCLNGWEKGKREPSVFFIKALTKELGVTVDWLLETGFEDQCAPSAEALEIAKQYDHLNADSKEVIKAVLRLAEHSSAQPESYDDAEFDNLLAGALKMDEAAPEGGNGLWMRLSKD